jgi:hypothetical protein
LYEVPTSVFELHSQVIADYRDFVRSFITIADEHARDFVDHSLDHEARFWPDPLLQVSPSYARSANQKMHRMPPTTEPRSRNFLDETVF